MDIWVCFKFYIITDKVAVNILGMDVCLHFS